MSGSCPHSDHVPGDDAHVRYVLLIFGGYLCLDVGDDASNIFSMGKQLLPLSKLSADTGVTTKIVHHFKKGSSVTESPPELEDIVYAGFIEWARQWLLLSRRSPYAPDRPGHHELWFAAGGSAGHSMAKALDIDEGSRDDIGGRRWEVTVNSIGAAIGAAVDAKEEAKRHREENRIEAAIVKAVDKIRAALAEHPEGLTARRIKEEYGIKPMMIQAAIGRLKAAGEIEECDIEGANKRTYTGFKLATGTSGNQRDYSRSIPVDPSARATGTGPVHSL